jgi:hypothetical protein
MSSGSNGGSSLAATLLPLTGAHAFPLPFGQIYSANIPILTRKG